MSIKLQKKNSLTCLKDEYKKMPKWYNSSLGNISKGYYQTVGEFYDNFVEPNLPDTTSVINWTKLLLNYVNTEDNRVFAVRNFFNYKAVNNGTNDYDSQLAIKSGKNIGDKNPYSLRRGFLTELLYVGHRYFFTDNFFAAYFLKMAYDGFVPSMNDFANEMWNKTFPGRFGRYCKEEKAFASYDIVGKIARDPGIKNRGYKIGHVIDSAKNYIDGNGNKYNLQNISNEYFPRGWYTDWSNNAKIRTMNLKGGGLDYLKAHFLRFACPINYFLAPKKNDNKRIYQEYGQGLKLITNKPDIAELVELQEYIIGKFHNIYGDIYDEFLTAIMWKKDRKEVEDELEKIIARMTELGNTTICLTVHGTPLIKSNSSTVTHKRSMTQKQKVTKQQNIQNRHNKISYDPNLKTATDREAYLLNGVSDNYKNKNGLKKLSEINGIVNTLFPGKCLFDLTNAQDIIDVWKEVKKQSWNEKTGRGIPAAIVSNYCVAVTGQAPR